VAGGFVLAMMLLTTSDVVLRLFRNPITGTYDMVGLLGAAFVSFALAHTSLEKGHIAVDFLVRKLPPRPRRLIDAGTELLSLGLFILVCVQSLRYAGRLRRMGEVSLTLRAPLHPFVYGIAVGSGMLCLVLLLRAAASLRALREDHPPRPR
jgi:TRAP-type C4-dicarboxylate transport system permease small subunit